MIIIMLVIAHTIFTESNDCHDYKNCVHCYRHAKSTSICISLLASVNIDGEDLIKSLSTRPVST